jgi:hypothetical protein
MNLNTTKNSKLNHAFNTCYLLNNCSESKPVVLFYPSLKIDTNTTSIHEWTEKACHQINKLEKLVYNSHHLCPAFHLSIVTRARIYNKMILAFEKKLFINETELSKENDIYHKRLQKIQQRIQIVLMYFHV